jgi:O-antigen ligase
MGLSVLKIISFLNIALFLALMLFSRYDKNRLYVQFVLLSFPFLAINLTPISDGFVVASYVFILLFYRNKKTEFTNGRLYTTVTLLLIAMIITGIFVCELGPGFETYKEFIAVIPVFIFTKVLIEECIYDHDFFYEVIRYMKIIVLFSFVFLFLQMVIGVQFSLAGSIRPNVIINGAFRYTSFLSDPQHYAQYLGVLGLICMIRKENSTFKEKAFDLTLVGLCLVGIMFSGGRGGLFGLILGMALVLLFSKPSLKISMLVGVVILYFIIMAFQDSFSMFKRSTDVNDTYEFRHSIWMEAYQMFEDSPLFGIGIGNYPRHVMLHNPNQFWLADNEWQPFDVPESGFLKILSELGATGFILIFFLILFPLIKSAFLFLKTKDFTLLYLVAAILSWMVSFNGTYSFFDSRIKLVIATIVCLMIVYIHFIKTEEEEGEEEEALETASETKLV